MAKVIAFMGESRRERVLFEGEQEDAEVFLQNNYPRIHVEPGMDYGDDGPPADAVVQDDDGNRQFWNGRKLLDWSAPATASNPSNARDTTNAQLADENARLRAQLAEAERRAESNTVSSSDAPDHEAGVDVQKVLDTHRQQQQESASVAPAPDESTLEGPVTGHAPNSEG